MIKSKEKNYIDITDNIRINKKYIVKDAKCFEDGGTKYYVDNHKVKLEYTKKEKEVAKTLASILHENILMCPKVNYPKKISTPDFVTEDTNEKWDLKEIRGSGIRNIDSKIKNCENQSNNFIIYNTKNILNERDIIKQVEKIFNDLKRKWVKKIIIIDKNKLIKYYKRK